MTWVKPILNSRLKCHYIRNDQFDILTPGHFLTGQSLIILLNQKRYHLILRGSLSLYWYLLATVEKKLFSNFIFTLNKSNDHSSCQMAMLWSRRATFLAFGNNRLRHPNYNEDVWTVDAEDGNTVRIRAFHLLVPNYKWIGSVSEFIFVCIYVYFLFVFLAHPGNYLCNIYVLGAAHLRM